MIGMSGASGAPLTVELLRQLHRRCPQVETHLIVTKGAEMTLIQETNVTLDELNALANVCHDNADIGASIASGSFKTEGMIVVPCSMKTVAGIVSGYSDNLLLRAADVCLKERRKLVLAARESPLSTLHLRNLYEASQLGAVIIPPMLTYYNHPASVEDCTRHVVNRLLAQFDLDEGSYQWEGMG
jgi:polyprenyl P-hydroxybenzoate/phenylacrylic acid decarboxylase-like protein